MIFSLPIKSFCYQFLGVLEFSSWCLINNGFKAVTSNYMQASFIENKNTPQKGEKAAKEQQLYWDMGSALSGVTLPSHKMDKTHLRRLP